MPLPIYFRAGIDAPGERFARSERSRNTYFVTAT